MSIAQHHNEWLSLIEISGPFLGLKTLADVFPQGLDNFDTAVLSELRQVYNEWADSQRGLTADPQLHTQWVRYILHTFLQIDPRALRDSAELQLQNGDLRPDFAIQHPREAHPRLLLQIYPEQQALEKRLKQEGQAHETTADPATRMMTLLRHTAVPLGLITNGEAWMLVYAPVGENATYVTWHAHLWLEERLTLRAFYSLLGNKRFFNVPDDETLPALLAQASQAQHDVTEQLGTQVRHATEILVQTLARVDADSHGRLLRDVSDETLYEAALTVMMRLVFLLSAEARGLLLLGDPIYDQHYAVSTLRAQLREAADAIGEEIIERRTDAWARLLATFRAVHGGITHQDLRLPAYGGSLFDPDRFPFLEGRPVISGSVISNQSTEAAGQLNTRAAGSLTTTPPPNIDNRTVLHLLEALQLLELRVGGVTTKRTLSFAALDIEQIGHVYEGLLDHKAVRAEGVVLGLTGSLEPELPLADLEAVAAQGTSALEKYLQEETGRSSVTTIRNLLEKGGEMDRLAQQRLSEMCGGDDALYRRISPFYGLLRQDTRQMPVVILPGEVYVTSGATRRQTGTHYTPRTLTEPIVQHTLEPLVYVGPAEGLPREAWTLKSPDEILQLTVCDMAMGSGAFLVQACRYLAERLVESLQYSVSSGSVISGGVISGSVISESVISNQSTEAAGQLNTRAAGSLNTGAAGSLTTRAAGSLNTGAAGSLTTRAAGSLNTEAAGQLTTVTDPDEQYTLAKRLIADRCLYGIDKNPLAVEMAKLSLWLITLDKNRPFTFLDHALRHGDSLVGASEADFLRWPQNLKKGAMPLFSADVQAIVQAARQKRQALRRMVVLDVRDAAEKRRLLAETQALTARIRYACDFLAGAHFLGLPARQMAGLLADALRDYGQEQPFSDPRAREAVRLAREQGAFHWQFEFPEVFAQGGFSAFVGNPPFIGGKRIRDSLGDGYRTALYELFEGSKGGADYSAFFFLQAYAHLHDGGTLGLIATNTIAQGDTLRTGLEKLHEQGAEVYRANNDYPWPGLAAVVVDVVHLFKGEFGGQRVLDDAPVENITPALDNMPFYGRPYKLKENGDQSFIGSFVNGMGFVMEPEEAAELIERNPQNKDVLFPYLNGQDLNSSPIQAPSRWVINFFDWPLERSAEGSWQTASAKQKKAWLQTGCVPADYADPVAADYPEILAIVRERVKPARDKVRRKAHRIYWWHYGDKRPALYETIAPLGRVLSISRVTKYVNFSCLSGEIVYSEATVILAIENFSGFACVQNTFHDIWAWMQASTMGGSTLRYSPSDAFETFPFPSTENMAALEAIGETYHTHRQQVMQAHNEGLTQTYNRFHDPAETSEAIATLRTLHTQLDEAVAVAYGWQDLALGHGFHETAQGTRYTISDKARRQVLTRLLKLNHVRYAAEVEGAKVQGARGKGRKGQGSGGKGRKGQGSGGKGQLGLFRS